MASNLLTNLRISHVEESIHKNNPKLCNLILWRQKNPGLMEKMSDKIRNCYFHNWLSTSPVTLDQVKTEVIFFYHQLQGNCWFRAKPLGSTLDSQNLMEIRLIDHGQTCLVPLKQLNALQPLLSYESQRSDEYLFLRSTPPVATQYLLADVVIDKSIESQDQESALQFVKRFLIEPNLIVNAVFEETVDDVQLIRVFSVKTNKLLAETIVNKNMAIAVDRAAI